MTTKQKIIVSSIKLFNLHGLTNVRLQQIADDVGISVGNLAYHYYSKEAIVKEIDKQLSELITPIISSNQSFPCGYHRVTLSGVDGFESASIRIPQRPPLGY